MMPIPQELFSDDDERAEAALAGVEPGWLPELVAALADRSVDKRWWAVRALALLPGDRATAALLSAAGDQDPTVRAAAFFALGERAAPEAVAPLVRALGDPSEYQARLAADALSRLGRLAVPALIDALGQASEPRVRLYAARALAAIGDTSAIPALFEALEDESALVQYWADEALERMGVGQVYFKP
jgi:HEAT repeat protein